MPIYEFRCDDCQEKFSEIRKMGDDLGVPCQSCGSLSTRKLISTFASISSSGKEAGCASASRCPTAAGGG